MDNVLAVLGNPVSERQSDQFRQYFDLLSEWNSRMNLTAIESEVEVYIKHFHDSLLIRGVPEWEQIVERRGECVDVGTGAGFPGLPLAILYPEVHFTLCDALAKRVRFLEHVGAELGLKNVQMVHGRAEDLARVPSHRMRFDAVVSRAVARLNILMELTSAFVKPNGFLFAYKGPNVDEEFIDANRAGDKLGLQLVRKQTFSLPESLGERAIVILKQVKQTPKAYPRKAGTPQKTPL